MLFEPSDKDLKKKADILFAASMVWQTFRENLAKIKLVPFIKTNIKPRSLPTDIIFLDADFETLSNSLDRNNIEFIAYDENCERIR